MTQTIDPMLILAALTVALIGVFVRYRKDKAHIGELQRSATRAFKESSVNAGNPMYAFVGGEATVVRREETGGLRGLLSRTADFSVTIYALNHYGESFLFKWHSKSSKPLTKHLPRGERYLPDAARVKVVVALFMQPAAAYLLLSSAPRRASRVRD